MIAPLPMGTPRIFLTASYIALASATGPIPGASRSGVSGTVSRRIQRRWTWRPCSPTSAA